jgi:hypothetical protein
VIVESADQGIAVVESNQTGRYVKAIRAGKTLIRVSVDSLVYNIPVLVKGPSILGDFDSDGDIDNNDIGFITNALNTPAYGTDDPRDLDRDGKITSLDARKLILLCTRPRCSTQ